MADANMLAATNSELLAELEKTAAFLEERGNFLGLLSGPSAFTTLMHAQATLLRYRAKAIRELVARTKGQNP